MGDPKGFMKYARKESGNRPIEERVQDFTEVEQTLNKEDRLMQAARCMDCGVPFCNWACPVQSVIPEWQDALSKKQIKRAYEILVYTNDFPEFTGRICPAPCEKSCTLNLHDAPVTIRENEVAIVERNFSEGYIVPRPPAKRSGKKVAVIGSGPAGLSAAAQLNYMGHTVTVFEKANAIGGLLRYGIPDFKLSKHVIDRRLSILEQEGIEFKVNAEVGKTISGKELLNSFDAICLATGAEQPRDLPAPGREQKGIYFAMEFLIQQNKMVRGEQIDEASRISAKGKKVLVIGGGDTGSDCVGTSIRQGATSVMQIEILPKPPAHKNPETPWPFYPTILKTSTSHEEGCDRRWCLATKEFIGENGQVKQVKVIETEWTKDENGQYKMSEKAGSEQIIEADLVFLAMGFTQPVHDGLLNELGVSYDPRNNVKANDKNQTSVDKVFVAGDTTLGASLVVKAIFSGRQAAKGIDTYLMGE